MKGAGPQILGTGAKFKRVPCQKSCRVNRALNSSLVITSQFLSRPSLEFIQVGDENIQKKSFCPEFGGLLLIINLTELVEKICGSCHHHLKNIAKIRKYLIEDASEILVHTFNSSKLDNCKSLLYGLPKHLSNRLRSIKNTAALTVTLIRWFDHITQAIMFKLHWLPLNYRIHFNTLLLVYKCPMGLAATCLSELLRYHDSPRLLPSSQNL